MRRFAKVLVLVLGLMSLSQVAASDEAPPSPCVDALEQIAALNELAPAYKELENGERHYLEDANRPAEIARLQRTVSTQCSKDGKARATEEAAAQRLRVARSPLCAIERDKLSAMERPDSREARDSVESQRKLVAQACPSVSTRDVWLLQMVWIRP